jgi:hypothetical protein
MITYKVVTNDMKSLGLRKNPTILKYSRNKWKCISDDELRFNNNDEGGIWVCKNLSGATKLRKYMKQKYNKLVRIFISEIDVVLYENSYRIKTNAVKLLLEIK